MAKNTGIAWCDHTHNLWWGCVERGPGCLHCYARELAKRWGYNVWGPNVERRIFDEEHTRHMASFARAAAEAGESQRVFVGSMMDLAEEREDLKPIVRAFLRRAEIYAPMLDLLCLTKRPENYEQILRDCYPSGQLPPNVFLGASAVTQEEANRHAPVLADVARRWGAVAAFLSMEPQIEGIIVPRAALGNGGITQLITGGESGGKARPYHVSWGRDTILQAHDAGIAAFVKQLGAKPIGLRADVCDACALGFVTRRRKPGGRPLRDHGMDCYGGPLLEDRQAGADPAEWPTELRVQEFPVPRRPVPKIEPVRRRRALQVVAG